MIPYKILATIVNKIARLFFTILGFYSTVITLLAPLEIKKQLPPFTGELLKISAKQLASKIRRKEVKSQDVVEAYINRIKEVNPFINAVVGHRFAEAINEAICADLMVEAADNPEEFAKEKPLLGIPLTVKETIAVEGCSNNSSRSRVASRIAEDDAECIKLLRHYGAIPILVSNTPELCLYFETYNPTHGTTNNPYDIRRTSAGSSGGEAALAGAGASLIGIGSDVAGSIRLPVMFCGVFGHKPTPGFVPNSGHIPSSKDPMWDYYFSLGPIARYAEDLSLLLQCMIPRYNHIEKLSLDEHVDITKLAIHYMYGEGKDSVLQDEPNFQIKKAVKTAVDIMSQHYGCVTAKVDLSCFKNSLAFTMFILQTKGVENIFQKNDENPDDYDTLRMLEVVFKKFTFQSRASLSSVLYGPLQCLINRAPNIMKEKLKERLEYTREKVLDILGYNGVLIYPTFPTEATYHNRMSGQIMNISYCTLFNVLGLPVTQCHIRYTREGLPVGVQIIAAPEKDRLCLAVAEAITAVTGGWQPPDAVNLEPQ